MKYISLVIGIAAFLAVNAIDYQDQLLMETAKKELTLN